MRLGLGPLALAVALMGAPHWIFLPLLVVGTLSDIYDGLLARRFGVATPALRRYDSVTDVIYYLFILAALWQECHAIVSRTWWAIALILLTEAAVIVVCYAKFGRYPATHSWLAKIYGLCLLFSLTALLAFDAGDWAVITLAVVAVVTNCEIILLHLISPVAPVDVPSIFKQRKP